MADRSAQGLKAALSVLHEEADALAQLFATFEAADGRLLVDRALDLLHGATGRVIVTGMGKSGHIARKIAATMASTGTPAQFVHPAEASHGDMGMITSADAVLALSNSGETAELNDLIAYSRRWRIPLIGITSRGKSTLGNAADVTLALPPTGSTAGVISPDLSTNGVSKIGFIVHIEADTSAAVVTPASKTGDGSADDAVSAYFAEAHPVTVGSSGQ